MPSSRATALIGLGLASSLLLLGACGDKSGSGAATPSASTSTLTSTSGAASASTTPSASTASVKPSTNLDAVTVSGDYGKAPKVAIKSPWAIDKTQTKVLKANDGGATIKDGATVEVNYAGYDGRTGKKFDDSYSRGKTASFPLDQVVPGFKTGLLGQHQGSRVLIAMTGKDGYDASGGNAQAGINVGDSLVFVVDVVGVPLDGPQGTAVTPKPGLPTVTDVKGVPKVTIPKSDPPAKLQVQPLIKGNGKLVTAADTIMFNYQWVTWSDGKVVEQSYGAKPASTTLSGLLPGLVTGLTGQTVGSRVLLVVPPDQGYPTGNASPKINSGETLVFVVDLLFASAG